MKRQVRLKDSREPLQIAYPANFQGAKQDPDADEILISREFHVLTDDEIGVVESYLKLMPYKQSLAFGAVMIEGDDPLLSLKAEALNQVEKDAGLRSTEFAPQGGQRSLYERVLILRESGFEGTGLKPLAASS